MMTLYNRYASKQYQNRPFKALLLTLIICLLGLVSFLHDQLYAFFGAVIVMGIAIKHILEYIELTYQQREFSISKREEKN